MAQTISWIKNALPYVPEFNEIPLFGNAPHFDWAHLSHQIASYFGVEKLRIKMKECDFREKDALTKGLGTDLLTLPIHLTPLGSIYWMMSASDITRLCSFMIRPSNKAGFSSEVLQEGFYRFVILETLNVVQKMAPFSNLSLQIGEEELSCENGFCLEIEIELDGQTCFGRCVIPKEFRAQWIQHFSQTPSEYIPTEITQKTLLTIGVKTGSVLLHQEEYKSIRPGDFVLLDKESYDARKGSGLCTITLQSTPLFNAKIKQNKMELIDYAFYYEENMEQNSETASEPMQKLPEEKGEAAPLKEMPLYITVEIARLKITLDQLMRLTPGNTLELPIHPDQGVSLTINGQKVGRAELLYLGEQLGIRILEI